MEQAADLGGISHVTWRRIENAHTVKPASYRAVDRFLDLNVGTTERLVLSPRTLSQDEWATLERVMGITRSFTTSEMFIEWTDADGSGGVLVHESSGRPQGLASLIPTNWRTRRPVEDILDGLAALSISDLDKVINSASAARHAKAAEVFRMTGLFEPNRLEYLRVVPSFESPIVEYATSVDQVIKAFDARMEAERAYIEDASDVTRSKAERLADEYRDTVRAATERLRLVAHTFTRWADEQEGGERLATAMKELVRKMQIEVAGDRGQR